jgi:DNA segregation ATPase FtsK/SpoIIIE-like protein
LSETSVDNYLTSKVKAKEMSDIITNFLQRFDSIIQLQRIIVMPLFSEITYDVEKPNIINNIFAMQNDLLQQLKIKSFNISYKGNIIRFEIPNQAPSKVSLKSVYSNMKNIPNNEMVIGVGENLNPLLVNLNKHRNIVLIGTKGSGTSMLMISMIVSLTYTNSPKNFNVVILSSTNDKTLKHLEKLPHLLFPIKYESIEITNSLIELQHEINYREELFRKNKVSSIDAYNNVKNSDIDYIKRIATFIVGFNVISKISLENSELIIDLLKRGPKVGISTILLTNSVDSELFREELYKNLDIKIVMKLEFEQESIQLLDSKRGAELFGNGDGYCFDKFISKYKRFQACYMNIEELLEIIKIINTFYSVKTKLN